MDWVRYGPVRTGRPTVCDDDGDTLALGPLMRDIDGAFLAAVDTASVHGALAAGSSQPVAVDGERIGPSVARPIAFICIGMSHATHAAGSGATPAECPVAFLKHRPRVVGPDDDVVIPRGSTRTESEVELTAVIKRTPRYLDDMAEAFDYVAGYMVANDVSERASQIDVSGCQWSKGRCAPTFSQVGPALRPVDGLDSGAPRLRSWVKEPRQDFCTAEPIFSVPA